MQHMHPFTSFTIIYSPIYILFNNIQYSHIYVLFNNTQYSPIYIFFNNTQCSSVCRVRNTRKVKHWGRGERKEGDDDDGNDDDDGDGLMISFIAKGGKCYWSLS